MYYINVIIPTELTTLNLLLVQMAFHLSVALDARRRPLF